MDMGSGFTKFINWLILIALIYLGFDFLIYIMDIGNNAPQGPDYEITIEDMVPP